MKKLFLIQLFTILSMATIFAQENSVLWKISGNNLKADSYLLGTIHILCPEDFVMHDKVKRVIGEVDQVIFEVDLFNPENTALMQQRMMSPTQDFLSNLKSDQIQLIDSVLTANQLSIKMFDMLHPAMVMSLLTLKSFNCPNPMEIKSVENEVHKLAEGKNIADLETIEFQMEMLSKIATPEYFYNYLKLYDEASKLTQQMVIAYNKQDLSILEEVITDPNWMTPEVYDLMLTQRNNNWLDIIPSRISENKTLIAVGAAHLIGKDGLIQQLREKGYTVTPVLN
ncbi:MAG TPA: TraB/GumN family protein [Sphingobacterium bovisgrunnientis]|jgi:uncharacterized protein YbaP (TraB family)|uniref:TraB/GumN family protein n=1 Tax=Sphingobacterium bovisgrunnientis TaxID=1874697 RepID=UPI001357FF8B|nr:TraB/GumN family protein [Sphingobacterium bovisgrunnientis]HLS38226.1 TraB/GumN family protein [Sphingobacterium bovisgrunnientis]